MRNEKMGFQKFIVDAPAGVNFSKEPSQLAPQLWDEANNITFRHGKTFKCNGYEEGFGVASATPEIILPLRDDTSSRYWWVYAGAQTATVYPPPPEEGGEAPPPTVETKDKIYRILRKDNHTDVTPLTGLPYQGHWSTPSWAGDSLNGTPYLCKEKLYVWNEQSQIFEPMNKFPEFLNFRTVRTFKNFIFGLDFYVTNDETEIPGVSQMMPGSYSDGIWWSQDIATSNLQVGESEKSLWCDSDANRSSGWNILGGSGGPIVDAKSMRDTLVIYRERSVWQASFVGGINIFNWRELFDDSGALSKNCIQEVEGQHFVIGHSDVYVHNGVQKQSIVDGVVRKKIFENIDPDYVQNVFTAADYDNKEFWVCVPQKRTDGSKYVGSCNVAFIYNWEEKTWARREIPDLISGVYSVLSIPVDDKSWQAPIMQTPWTAIQGSWLSLSARYNPSKWGFIMGSVRYNSHTTGLSYDWDDDIFWDDQFEWNEVPGDKDEYSIYTGISESTFEGRSFTGVVEKRWLEMGDSTKQSFVNKVFPYVRGSGGSSVGAQVKVYIAGTRWLTEPINYRYLGTFDGNRMGKLSARCSGNYIHLKFEIPETSSAEIRGYEIEFTKIGNRL